MSVHPYGAKLPYSRDEDKALVEFVRQNNGWHRVRGKQFWETSFRSNRVSFNFMRIILFNKLFFNFPN